MAKNGQVPSKTERPTAAPPRRADDGGSIFVHLLTPIVLTCLMIFLIVLFSALNATGGKLP